MNHPSIKTPECKVCLTDHDEELHQATLDLREWHRYQVTKYFEYTDVDESPAVAVTAA